MGVLASITSLASSVSQKKPAAPLPPVVTPLPEEDLVHLSPARFEHVNAYGKDVFPIAQASQRHELRPLRADECSDSCDMGIHP